MMMMQGATLRRRSVDASDVEADVGSAHSAPLRGRQALGSDRQSRVVSDRTAGSRNQVVASTV